MDSAGLGALIGGIRRAREADGDVSVACSRPTLTRLLHTTGFDRIVPVTETVDAADRALLDPPDDLVETDVAAPRVARRRGDAPTSARPSRSCTSRAEERHPHDRRRGDPLGQAGQVLLLVGRDLAEVGQVGVEPAEVGAGEACRPARASPPARRVAEPRVHPVDDQRPHGDAGLAQPGGEVGRLLDDVARGARPPARRR